MKSAAIARHLSEYEELLTYKCTSAIRNFAHSPTVFFLREGAQIHPTKHSGRSKQVQSPTMEIFFYSIFAILLLSTYANLSHGASFLTLPCAEHSLDTLESYIGQQAGISADEVHSRLVLADLLGDRAFKKTWATHKTLSEYQTLPLRPPNPPPNVYVKEDRYRFAHPFGECSGYGRSAITNEEPYRTWEMNAKKSADLTYAYLVEKLGDPENGIQDFRTYFPGTVQDNGCEHIFRATHAELKLLTRLMVENELGLGDQLFMSVSRHMCRYCRDIMAHLARNGNRKVFVVSPRKGDKDVEQSNYLDQPEFIFFNSDGSFERYERDGASAQSPFKCTKTIFFPPLPNNIDTYISPHEIVMTGEIPQDLSSSRTDRNSNSNATKPRKESSQVQLSKPVASSSSAGEIIIQLDPIDPLSFCPAEEIEDGPSSDDCFTIIGSTMKTLDCPRPETVTGIHGTFGEILEWEVVPPPIVLFSIGPYCDETRKVDAMGPVGGFTFDIQCPTGYQVTGMQGNFGVAVDKIGVICQRISDGDTWISPLEGYSTGGIYRSSTCSDLGAGRTLNIWAESFMDGLGMCCR